MKARPVVVTLFGLAALILLENASARNWSDNTGQFSIEAEYVGMVDDEVVLKRIDGVLIRVPVARLSEADQQHVKLLVAGKTQATGRRGKDQPAPLPPETKSTAMGNGPSADSAIQTVIVQGTGTSVDEASGGALCERVAMK